MFENAQPVIEDDGVVSEAEAAVSVLRIDNIE
jgi:hypothetical protein